MANLTTSFIRKVVKHQEAVKFTVADTSFPKFYLIVVLVCIFLITHEFEHLFRWFLVFGFPLLRTPHLDSFILFFGNYLKCEASGKHQWANLAFGQTVHNLYTRQMFSPPFLHPLLPVDPSLHFAA